ncbi:MAG: DUF3168 domain-containing protein [Mesorhizobium sp.]|nr:MAG: DUF3168 domain-containing protein [Mesorhizobium sp.]
MGVRLVISPATSLGDTTRHLVLALLEQDPALHEVAGFRVWFEENVPDPARWPFVTIGRPQLRFSDGGRETLINVLCWGRTVDEATEIERRAVAACCSHITSDPIRHDQTSVVRPENASGPLAVASASLARACSL